MTDPLALRAASGDPDAWREITRAYGPMLEGIARQHRLDAADAADVMQETWISLFRHAAGLDPAGLRGWLAVTGRNACLDRIRRNRRYVPCSDAPWIFDREPAPDIAIGVIAALEAARAVRLLKALPAQQGRALAARAQGLSVAEVAAGLGCSEGAAKSHLSRARTALRNAMRQERSS